MATRPDRSQANGSRATGSRAKGSRPKGSRPKAGGDDSGFLGDVQDLWQLVVAYFKQETVEPIKGLGRFLAFGLAGSLAVGLGAVLLVLGLLRLLQNETGDAFDGNLSVLPYLLCLVVAGGAAAAAVKAGSRDRRKA